VPPRAARIAPLWGRYLARSESKLQLSSRSELSALIDSAAADQVPAVREGRIGFQLTHEGDGDVCGAAVR
jgi:hypothetical protein